MDELQQLEDWAAPLLQALAPAQRTRLARTIGTALRRSQSMRIGQQMSPDGSAYAPRKQQARNRRGHIKRAAMFAKMRQAKHFKVKASPSEVAVGFLGRVARIATVHQEGLVDRVRPSGPRVRYERRQLLGFSESDRSLIRDLLLEHLPNV